MALHYIIIILFILREIRYPRDLFEKYSAKIQSFGLRIAKAIDCWFASRFFFISRSSFFLSFSDSSSSKKIKNCPLLVSSSLQKPEEANYQFRRIVAKVANGPTRLHVLTVDDLFSFYLFVASLHSLFELLS